MSRQEQIRQHRQQQLLNQQSNEPIDKRLISIENKQLIWKTLLSAGQFNEVNEKHKPDIMRQIDNTIVNVYNQYGSNLPLIELNKRVVLQMSQYITKLKNINKPEVYKSDKQDILNSNLQHIQNERTSTNPKQPHNEVNFEEPKEEKINMKRELKKLEEERKQLMTTSSLPPKGWMSENNDESLSGQSSTIDNDNILKLVTENNKRIIEMSEQINKIIPLLQAIALKN